MQWRFLATVVVAVLACGACSTDAAGTSGAGETDDDLKQGTTLTEADDGRTVAVVEGQTVLIALASNPTTGFDWAVTSADKALGSPTIKFVKGASTAVGSGGTTKLSWLTTTGGAMVGKHAVTLGYQRSWEKKDAKTFKVTIDVRAATAAKAVTIDDNDDGAVVVAKAGQEVVLSLASNPTTGFTWTVTSADKSFGFGSSTFKSSGSGAVGAGGTQVFTWKTTGPFSLAGTHKVALQYARAGDKTPDKTFSFAVKIQN